MGKSTAADILQRMSVPVVDSDDLARLLVQPGFPALTEIVRTFGIEYLDPHGNLNRSLLAQRVFNDPTSRKALEDILHPRIEDGWKKAAANWGEKGATWGCVVIPLLFEKGYATAFHATISVACTRTEQQKRLKNRGWSEGQIQSRIKAQWPVEQKMALAQFVVWTEGNRDLQGPQWERILAAV